MSKRIDFFANFTIVVDSVGRKMTFCQQLKQKGIRR